MCSISFHRATLLSSTSKRYVAQMVNIKGIYSIFIGRGQSGEQRKQLIFLFLHATSTTAAMRPPRIPIEIVILYQHPIHTYGGGRRVTRFCSLHSISQQHIINGTWIINEKGFQSFRAILVLNEWKFIFVEIAIRLQNKQQKKRRRMGKKQYNKDAKKLWQNYLSKNEILKVP